MDMTVVWLAVAAVMGIIEAFSLGLVTMWFVAGALAAFAANLFGAGLNLQIILFLVVSLACLVLLRPIIVKYRKRGQESEPTVVGSIGEVTQAIDADGLSGEVKLADRVSWTARSATGVPIALGEKVRVVRQESIKLIVEPVAGGAAPCAKPEE